MLALIKSIFRWYLIEFVCFSYWDDNGLALPDAKHCQLMRDCSEHHGMSLGEPAPCTTLKENIFKENVPIIWGFKSPRGQEMFCSYIQSTRILRKSLRPVRTLSMSSKMTWIISHLLLHPIVCQWKNFLTKKLLFSKGIKLKTRVILWHKK